MENINPITNNKLYIIHCLICSIILYIIPGVCSRHRIRHSAFTINIQHSTSDILHSTFKTRNFSIRHRTFNIRHPSNETLQVALESKQWLANNDQNKQHSYMAWKMFVFRNVTKSVSVWINLHYFSAFGIQHMTNDIQHLTFNIRHPTFNIRHSICDIRHPTSVIQHSTSRIRHLTF